MANYKDLKYIFPASSITSGTFSDARIAASNVSQHATSFDDNKIVNDISTLGLRVHTQENLNASNTNSASFDVFQDSSGITNLTNAVRDSNEFISTIAQTESAITLNNSNYTTYIDTTDNDMMSVVKNTSGLSSSGSGSHADITISNNVNFASSSSYQANQVVANSHEATLLGYIFGSPASDTAYLIQNSDTSNTYRLIYFNIGFKSGVTFKPNGTAGFRWRNGAGSFQGITFYGLDVSGNSRTEVGEYSGSVANGSSYTQSISNSTFYSGMSFRTYHSGDQSFMWDTLSVPGTVRQLSTTATGSFEGATITAGASTSKMGAVITYQDNAGTNTLNTDIILKLSADNGSNFSTATLTALPDFSTGIKMAKVNDLSVTAGTQLKYKIEFANQASGSKEARLRGVSLQY